MNCEHCQDLMQQRLDGQPVVEAPEMEGHLTECARCAALHAASLRLSAGLRLLTPPQPPLAFAERLVAEVLADQRTQRNRRRVRVAVCSLAASLLLGTAVGLYSFATKAPPIVVENHRPEPAKLPPSTPSPPTMRESVTDAGNAVVGLAVLTVEQTVSQTRLLVPMMTGPTLDELAMPPGVEPTKSYLETGQGVTVALEPVTNSAQRAINLFRRDLPQVDRSTKAQ